MFWLPLAAGAALAASLVVAAAFFLFSLISPGVGRLAAYLAGIVMAAQLLGAFVRARASYAALRAAASRAAASRSEANRSPDRSVPP